MWMTAGVTTFKCLDEPKKPPIDFFGNLMGGITV